MPAKFLYNLTKNLSAHLQHNLCAVLPKINSSVKLRGVLMYQP